MAIYVPRKAPLSWSFKWLHISSYSASSSDALQNEYGKLAYANMAGSKDASHSSVCCTCECTNKKSRGLTSVTHTKMVSWTSAENTTRRQNVRLLHVLPTSHAMARMPSGMIQGLHSTNAEANTQCCSCGKYKSEKGFLICPSCNAVQALNPAISHFQIFDQEKKFELDLKDLEAKYKSLMKKLHPDLSHGKSTEEKENSAQLSALVTTAYNELLKPVSRATYMLKLRGIRVEDEGTVTDSELIMEVMEIKETLQSSPDRKTLQQLQKTAMNRMDEWSEAFKSALKEGNDTNAVGALQRMSYFGRVCDDINRELL